MTQTIIDLDADSRFVEQAEYIPKEVFFELSSDHPREKLILPKLMRTGAKLLTGPRGCGKTTLMRKAFNLMLVSGNSALPIYVNFKASLRLEPIYKSSANGAYWFSTWMYLKILEGLKDTLRELDVSPSANEAFDEVTLSKIIAALEVGELEKAKSIGMDIDVYGVIESIDKAMSICGRSRCVLLLDDAAHAFSPEQQRDFFDFFRKIKSRTISPKAAIYPGVTNFAPTFNVGHDADPVDAWVDPEDGEYLDFMSSLIERRVPPEVFAELNRDRELLTVLCYSAFGIPRILLSTVRNLYSEVNEDGTKRYEVRFKRTVVLRLIKDSFNITRSVYDSLKDKYPSFINYISEGNLVFTKVLELIKTYNKDTALNKKSIIIAIRKELSADLKRIFGFFEYSGLASYKGELNKGEKGVFEQYVINISALINHNAITVARSTNVKDLAESLKSRNAHNYTRTQTDKLIPPERGDIDLSMPPCANCGTERLSVNSRFCHECGAELKASSIYEKLIMQDISVLPLTAKRIKRIKEESRIRRIKDILHDIGHEELKSVPQVGVYWAQRIYYVAEEYIS